MPDCGPVARANLGDLGNGESATSPPRVRWSVRLSPERGRKKDGEPMGHSQRQGRQFRAAVTALRQVCSHRALPGKDHLPGKNPVEYARGRATEYWRRIAKSQGPRRGIPAPWLIAGLATVSFRQFIVAGCHNRFGSKRLQLEQGGGATPFLLKDLVVRVAISIPTTPTNFLHFTAFSFCVAHPQRSHQLSGPPSATCSRLWPHSFCFAGKPFGILPSFWSWIPRMAGRAPLVRHGYPPDLFLQARSYGRSRFRRADDADSGPDHGNLQLQSSLERGSAVSG